MPRLSTMKHAELEAFWRSHLEGWRQSDLNQREYCEAHGLPLKRFGNWRAKFRGEDQTPPRQLLYRRGGGLSPMTKETPPVPASYIPSGKSGGSVGRRNFSAADKARIVEEASRANASVSGVARKYGIATSVVFRWRKEYGANNENRAGSEATFLPVRISDVAEGANLTRQSMSAPAPVIVERSAPGIEVELVGGRRVRFERDVDPRRVRRMVAMLEGEAQ